MKRRIPARAAWGGDAVWGILVCEPRAAALLWRGGGRTGAAAPVFLNTHSLRARDQGGVYSEASFVVSVYCAGKLRKEVNALRVCCKASIL